MVLNCAYGGFYSVVIRLVLVNGICIDRAASYAYHQGDDIDALLSQTINDFQGVLDIKSAPRGFGKGVMCLAGHLKPKLRNPSVYLTQCAYALSRFRHAFDISGQKNGSYRLAIVTDRFRYEHMVRKDAEFREFSERILNDVIFVQDWRGVPVLRQKPQSSKFQGFPQLWIHKFEAWARSPYAHTLFIDYDVHACPQAHRLFEIYEFADVAPTACEHGCWGGTRFDKTFGAYTSQLSEPERQQYAAIQEGQTSAVMLHTANPVVREMCIAARDIYIKTMLMAGNPIKHDQPALREVTYLWRHKLNHTKINETVGCDIKFTKTCSGDFSDHCALVHGKLSLEPLAGKHVLRAWAPRIGEAI
ncbi:hypothetical protein CYMTET_47170 [Cymbomonas tetramitiformis]|uniref:Uncharacterized protein n=1 Tax=Cymbomonas tetramitiformis TaxID=36881 RepID=A0AAE0BUQ7_9CHLO|nr:hypothetical protein CYMTET_47170 [Cymbomonas tetramitiformis]